MDGVVAEDETGLGVYAVMAVYEGLGCIFSCEPGADAGVAWVEDDG